LFALNAREIKEDVVENIKSLDGDTLVNAIDSAIASGSWDQAREIWAYIKSRRRQLSAALNEEERAALNSFIEERRAEGLYILSRGSLERYLPTGLAGKDLEKLIGFLSEEGFAQRIPSESLAELHLIAERILAWPPISDLTAEIERVKQSESADGDNTDFA
jgi:hypothetical protein